RDARPEDRGRVFTGQQGLGERARAQLDPLPLPQHLGRHRPPAGADRVGDDAAAIFAGVRHGTPPASRILPMTRSGFVSSASASKVSSTRWRSTSYAIAFTSSGTTYDRPRRYAWARAAWAR